MPELAPKNNPIPNPAVNPVVEPVVSVAVKAAEGVDLAVSPLATATLPPAPPTSGGGINPASWAKLASYLGFPQEFKEGYDQLRQSTPRAARQAVIIEIPDSSIKNLNVVVQPAGANDTHSINFSGRVPRPTGSSILSRAHDAVLGPKRDYRQFAGTVDKNGEVVADKADGFKSFMKTFPTEVKDALAKVRLEAPSNRNPVGFPLLGGDDGVVIVGQADKSGNHTVSYTRIVAASPGESFFSKARDFVLGPKLVECTISGTVNGKTGEITSETPDQIKTLIERVFAQQKW